MGWGPKAPDMSGANEAARAGAEISREQWQWTKDRQPKIDQQTDRMIQISEDQYALNREDQVFQQGLTRQYNDRFWGTQVPLQDGLLKDAMEFDTEARRNEMAAEATADVNSAYSNARDQQSRGLSRMGVNPSSGRYAAMDNQMAISQAAAQASASNKVRTAARLEGYSRKADANAMLSGLSGFSSSAAGLSNSFGQSSQGAGAMGMAGLNQGSTGYYTGASSAASGLQSASSNLRANAVESAKNPAFDALMGLAAGGMQMYGTLNAPVKK